MYWLNTVYQCAEERRNLQLSLGSLFVAVCRDLPSKQDSSTPCKYLRDGVDKHARRVREKQATLGCVDSSNLGMLTMSTYAHKPQTTTTTYTQALLPRNVEPSSEQLGALGSPCGCCCWWCCVAMGIRTTLHKHLHSATTYFARANVQRLRHSSAADNASLMLLWKQKNQHALQLVRVCRPATTAPPSSFTAFEFASSIMVDVAM